MTADRALELRRAKLARLLNVSADALPELDAATLDVAWNTVSEALYTSDAALLRPLVNVLDRVPASIAGKVATRVPPRFAARLAIQLKAGSGSALIDKLPDSYLADTAAELEHERATAILSGIPPERIAAVSLLLAAAGQFDAMAGIAGQLPDASLAAAIEALSDADVRATIDAGEPAAVDRALALVPADRRARLLSAAA